MNRQPLRSADKQEIAHVLSLAKYAENIMSDGLSYYWTEPDSGISGQFSTQAVDFTRRQKNERSERTKRP